MKIASIQLNIVWENPLENLKRAEKFIEKAKFEDCDLVVFPEMFNSGFSMNADVIAEPIDGKTCQLLSKLANKHQVNIIAGMVQKQNNEFSNISVMFDRKGKLKARYVKNYPYSNADEDKYYIAGDKPEVFEIDGIKSSVFICYDLRFPELFRKVAKQVELIFVIASWPETRQDHWQTLLKSRAIENQCFVAGVNRIGTDGNQLNYIGGSQVYDPMGVNLSTAGKNDEYTVTTINVSEVKKVRTALPFLNDIKENTYEQ